MANHISLTSIDGTMVIVDKNRIVSCNSCCIINKEKYEGDHNLWQIKMNKVMDNSISDRSIDVFTWQVNNPAPCEKNYSTGEKMSIIEMSNNNAIKVKESPEEIFKQIKSSI